ncbi:MAG TPA: TetR family transcriptional regulator [Burkholderiaceae bacterium]|jgi:AcrR family transcriptional regulator
MARRKLTTHSAVPPAEPVETRERLKRAARRLFAQRGIDGVTVRDIVAEGGQRNAASIFYYFGTKDALVKELIVDGAKRIDDRRNAAFDELERRSTAPSLRKVVETLVRTSFAETGEAEGERNFLRFIATLQISHRDLFLSALDGHWNTGFQRALAHIRRRLPKIAPPLLSQRLVFLSVYLGNVLAAREAALDDPARTASSLRGDLALENLIDTLVAMLVTTPSKPTLKTLPAVQTPPTRARRPSP